MADFWTKRTGNTQATAVTWTTATRPTSPFDGQTGMNTDHDGIETYSAASSKWRIINGTWTTATRPTTTNIDVGSMGYNSDAGLEFWNGSEWQLV